MTKSSGWLLLALFTFGLSAQSAHAQWQSQKESIMGTNIYAEVWSEDAALGKQALTSIMFEMERINQLMSPYIETSELSKLNSLAGASYVPVSQELYDLIKLSVGISQETDGAFDITFASVGFLYDYREAQKPTNDKIDQLLSAINFNHIKFNEAQRSIFFSNPNVKIDLGGIAKGHAIDNAIAILKAQGIQHALVTAGGDTGLLGDRLGRPWMVGVRDPRNRDRKAVVLPLENTSMSTSGDYERYFEEDGTRYHHIIAPTTGKSVYEVQSVTIVGAKSTFNDALSTAVFVLGVQKGIDLINRTPGYDAIIVDNKRKLHYSKELVP
jgi:thiamine biosynthesis lipoprotein